MALFEDVKYYLSGEVPGRVDEALRAGGAERVKYFTDFVSHLIWGREAAESDLADAEDLYEIPAASAKWVAACVRLGRRASPKPYAPPRGRLFAGVVACIARVRSADAKALFALITFHGGRAKLRLDRECTHLISGAPAGAKYAAALATPPTLEIVTPDWVVDSVGSDALRPCDAYHPRLLAPPEEPRAPSDASEIDSTRALVDKLKMSMPRSNPQRPPAPTAPRAPRPRAPLQQGPPQRQARPQGPRPFGQRAAPTAGQPPRRPQHPTAPNNRAVQQAPGVRSPIGPGRAPAPQAHPAARPHLLNPSQQNPNSLQNRQTPPNQISNQPNSHMQIQNQQNVNSQIPNSANPNLQIQSQQSLNAQMQNQQSLSSQIMNSQMQNQQALNSQMQNQQVLNSQLQNQHALNSQLQNQQVFASQIQNQQALNSQIQNQQALNTQMQSQQNLNPQIQIQQNSNSQIQNQQGLNPQIQNQQGINSQIQTQQGLNPQIQTQQVINSQIQNQQGMNSQIQNQQGMNSQIQNQQGMNSQIQNQQGLNSQLSNQQNLNVQIQNQQNLNAQIQNQQSLNAQVQNQQNLNVQIQNQQNMNVTIPNQSNVNVQIPPQQNLNIQMQNSQNLTAQLQSSWGHQSLNQQQNIQNSTPGQQMIRGNAIQQRNFQQSQMILQQQIAQNQTLMQNQQKPSQSLMGQVNGQQSLNMPQGNQQQISSQKQTLQGAQQVLSVGQQVNQQQQLMINQQVNAGGQILVQGNQHLNLQGVQPMVSQNPQILSQNSQQMAPGGQQLMTQGGQQIITQNGQQIIAQSGQQIISQNRHQILSQGQQMLNPGNQQLLAQGNPQIVSQGHQIIAQGGQQIGVQQQQVLNQNPAMMQQQNQQQIITHQSGQQIITQGGSQIVTQQGNQQIITWQQQQQFIQQRQQQIISGQPGQRVSWGTGPGRQLIHLDAQTHAQLQQMDPKQRALFVAQLQKRRQLSAQRAVQQQVPHPTSHTIALVRGPLAPGMNPHQQVQWVQQQGIRASPAGSAEVAPVIQQQTQSQQQQQPQPPTPQQQQQFAQLQLRQQQHQRLQRIQTGNIPVNVAAQNNAAPRQIIGSNLQDVTGPQADGNVVPQGLTPDQAIIPVAGASPLVVNPRTKTALANLLSIRLQNTQTPHPQDVTEPSAAGTLRLMTAAHNAPPRAPTEVVQTLQQRRTLTANQPTIHHQLPVSPHTHQQTLTKPAYGAANVVGAAARTPTPVPPTAALPRVQFYGHNPNLKLPPDLFLLGCIFHIVEYGNNPDHDIKKWTESVGRHGGEIELGYCPRVTHVLSQTQKHGVVMQALRDAKRCVTAYWLSDTMTRKQVVPPWQALHLPLMYAQHDRPAQRHCVSITGFAGEERDRITFMVDHTGAKLTKYMSRDNTVLVCRRPEGIKYQRAREWGIPAVSVQWLTDLLLGNMSALTQMEHSKYQQFNVQNPFRMDYALIPHLMHPWKMPINITQESHERVKRGALPTVGSHRAKKPRLTLPMPIPTSETIICSALPDPANAPRVMFSCIKDTEPYANVVRQLGGIIVVQPSEATHLVMGRLVRTPKFLLALVNVRHILTTSWLLESQKICKFAEESKFPLRDEYFDGTFKCDISKVMNTPITERTKLFDGITFYMTPGVQPSRTVLTEMIETCGGKVDKNRKSYISIQEIHKEKPYSYLVLTAMNDLHLVYYLLQAEKNLNIVCSTELVLTSILRQKVEVLEHLVKID